MALSTGFNGSKDLLNSLMKSVSVPKPYSWDVVGLMENALVVNASFYGPADPPIMYDRMKMIFSSSVE